MAEPTNRTFGQLAFEFPHCPSFADTDFLIAPCNADAVAWIERWPEWPTPALALVGPAGAGKSHLATIFATRAGAATIAPEVLAGLDPIAALGSARAAVIDGAEEAVADHAAAEGLFHLYNRLTSIGGHLLLTGRTAPARWRTGLADLASRLATATVAEIAAPDEALLASILAKLFADRQLRPAAEVIRYILARAERSPAALAAVVAALDRKALAGGRAVTVALAAETLRDLGAAQTEMDMGTNDESEGA
jgi:chromosomal replication initiation ATPase DnaA